MGINTKSGRRAAWSGLGLAVLLGSGLFLMQAHAVPGAPKAQTPPSGKVTPWEAMKIATANTPGKPVWATFEYEGGKWLYGVVVASGKTLHEVEIDANTGKVGDSEVITPDAEGRETAAELKAAIGIKSKAKPAGKEADEKGEKE